MRPLLLAIVLILAAPSTAMGGDPYPGCYSVPVTLNTPSGIAGCEVWGEGIASWYGSGGRGPGVAMNFCTWAVRHATGCGSVKVTSISTGLVVIAPVVDFCDCYTGTSDERIADLQPLTLAALGLNQSAGLYRVIVGPYTPSLPNTAMLE